MTDLQIGIALPVIQDLDTLDGVGGVAAAARHVEQVGLDHVGIADLVVGDGTPALDAVVAAAAVATATERVGVEFGVLALPLRPVAQLASQLATLQYVSGGRLTVGVGVGGFPGTPYWQALDVRASERGRRTDAALHVLPRLVAGDATRLGHPSGGPVVTLAPPAAVPPILVGGSSDAAIRRAATRADGWSPSLLAPDELAAGTRTLRELAAAGGRATPTVHYGTHAILAEGPAARQAREEFVAGLAEHGIPPDRAETIPLTGRPAQVAERLAAYAAAGADALTLALDGGDWQRQCELVATARALLD